METRLAGQPAAADVTGRASVASVSGPTVPFIVDWKPEDRGDLEEAVSDGVAVVAFDQSGLRLLKRCHLKGDYGYLPLEPKKDVIRFDSAREIKANLPVGGPGLALKIGGGFEQGKTLDLAYVMVGKRRTTWSDPTLEDVQGKCDGATHYVRAITVGAFAMKTGSRDKAYAVADIFAASASAGGTTSGDVSSVDGDLAACAGIDQTPDQPPARCRSLLRLELEPIAPSTSTRKVAGGAPAEGARVEARTVVDCGEGMVFANGKCATAAADRPRFCAPDDLADCEAQCQRGDAMSCDRAGYLIATGKGAVDHARADALFERACDADVANACVNLGLRRLYGTPVSKPSQSGLTILDKACRSGEPRGCTSVGDALWMGAANVTKDVRTAVRYYTAGCNGGDAMACTNLGVLYMGAGSPIVPIDAKKSLELSVRACNGGVSTACGNTGLRYEFGMDVPKDLGMAEALFKRACQISDGDCLRLGILYQHGVGGHRDDRVASALYERSCSASEAATSGFPALACHLNAKVYGAPTRSIDAEALKRTLEVMKPQCEEKISRACSFYGVAAHALGRSDAGQALKLACALGDPWGCDLGKRLKN